MPFFQEFKKLFSSFDLGHNYVCCINRKMYVLKAKLLVVKCTVMRETRKITPAGSFHFSS